MAAAALGLCGVALVLLGVIRVVIQRHRTGDSGLRVGSAPRGSLPWWADRIAGSGRMTTGFVAPTAELIGVDPLGAFDRPGLRAFGAVLAVLGIPAAFTAQLAMGTSWRVGVDEKEYTGLVTTGAFRAVRNPIFTALIVAFGGLALMVPNWVALAGFTALFIGIQMQVRLVEEPYLCRVHGAAYQRYAASVGRFLPGIGRLRCLNDHVARDS